MSRFFSGGGPGCRLCLFSGVLGGMSLSWVYKTPFFTEYKVIMFFLPRGICSKKQNTLYMVWIYTREKLTIINTGLFRAQHLNYGSNVSQYWIKSGISQSMLNRFSCDFEKLHSQVLQQLSWKFGKVWSIILKIIGQLRLTR